jgi:hypothetical protein
MRVALGAVSACAGAVAEQAELDASMSSEQARLAAEGERQSSMQAAAAAKRASASRSVDDDFAYTMSEPLTKTLKAFRSRGKSGDALLLSIDHEAGAFKLQAQLTGLTDVSSLADHLDDATPRFALYIHALRHTDGRVQYPIVLILYRTRHTAGQHGTRALYIHIHAVAHAAATSTRVGGRHRLRLRRCDAMLRVRGAVPETVPTQLKVLYTRPVASLAETCQVPRHLLLSDADDLSVEWLEAALKG